MAERLVGSNYTTPDLVAKVTGRARYAEDFRAEGMLFCKLLLEPDAARARAPPRPRAARWPCPGVRGVITADDLPDLGGAERALTNEPLYQGEPILALAAVERRRRRPKRSSSSISTSSRCLSRSIRSRACGPDGPDARTEGNVWGAGAAAGAGPAAAAPADRSG